MSSEYHERLGTSSFLQDKINKGTGAAKTFDKKDVYQLRITSFSDFTVILNSRITGSIQVEPGDNVFFYGSARYPTDLNLSIEFNNAALASEYLLIETITAHGNICSNSPN